MIEASIDHAEEDYAAAQLATARVDADTILAATDKAKRSDVWFELPEAERKAIGDAVNQLQLAYHSDDHHVIRAKIDALNDATQKLAENLMNTAVQGALRGTKI
jgi:molecular chaperone DnaK